MVKPLDILRSNRIYAALILLLIGVNLFIFLPRRTENAVKTSDTVPGISYSDEKEDVPDVPARRTMFNREEVAARQARVEAIAKDDPVFFFFIATVNFAIFFIILLGIVFDALVLVRRKKGEKLNIALAGSEPPRWKVSDVFRAVIIFVFAGYVFAFIQGMLSGKVPILMDLNFRMVSDTAFMNIAGITVIFYFVFRKYGHGASAIGLSAVSPLKVVLTALAGYVAIVPVLTLIILLTFVFIRAVGYDPPVQPIVEVFIEEKKASVIWMSVVFAAIFGPVAEEIFFRGFMYPAVKKKWGVAAALIATSAIFSLLHAHAAGFLPIMALGVFLAYLYERTGSLFVPMAVHMIHNMCMLVMVMLARAIGT
jgi:uncharacterized protein